MTSAAPHNVTKPARELLIADQADLLLIKRQAAGLPELVALLSPHHHVHAFSDDRDAVRYAEAGHPVDLIILDVDMPSQADHLLCRSLRTIHELQDIPVVFITEAETVPDTRFGLSAGNIDFIHKPLSPAPLLARVANHVSHGRVLRLMANQNDALDRRVAERTVQLAQRNRELQHALKQLAKTQDITIIAFSSLAETRDNETGRHLRRTQNYIRELALALRNNRSYAAELDDETIDLLYKSAPLHDIGKVAIPDHILLKKGRLEPAEFAIMKTHAEHGFRVISSVEAELGERNSFLHVAREIAYGHHEKWDGSGYPNAHAGPTIPLPARLMALADVYDALISQRIYKNSMSHAAAAQIIATGSGSHFDPAIVKAFMGIQDKFAQIASDTMDKPVS